MNDGEKMKEQVLALIYAGDFAQAEEKIKSFLQREPQNAELMGFLAGIYIEKQMTIIKRTPIVNFYSSIA